MVELFFVYNEFEESKNLWNLFLSEQSEKNWQNYVNSLEKSFTNFKDLSKGTKLENLFKAYQNEKRIDPLLIFIRESRNTIHHSAKSLIVYEQGDLADSLPFEMSMTFEDGKTIDLSNRPMYYLNPILSTLIDKNGKPVLPPAYHQGIALKNPKSLLEVGQKALEYYTKMYEDVKVKNK